MDDLISRAAACDVIGEMIKEYREKGEDDLADGMILARRYGIKRLPAVDAAPVVHGEWKWSHGGECSECGFHNSNFDYRYCPTCGAKMDGERRGSE
jgi:hypothetical protein